MDKKYNLTKNTIVVDGKTLYQIKALKNFGDVKKGDLGGFIESEKNLSQDGKCWVYNNAMVYENARIIEKARIYDDSKIFGNVKLMGNVKVSGSSIISGNMVIKIYSSLKNARISNMHDIMCFSNFPKPNYFSCFYKTTNDGIWVNMALELIKPDDPRIYRIIGENDKEFDGRVGDLMRHILNMKDQDDRTKYLDTLEIVKRYLTSDQNNENLDCEENRNFSNVGLNQTYGKKYELTDEKIRLGSKTLYRIRALRSFGYVVKGELGGFVESEENLSHTKNCWIKDNAKVYGNAEIFGNAEIYNDAEIYGNARVAGNAKVFGSAKVYDDATVHENAIVYGKAKIHGCSEVHDHATVYGNANVFEESKVFEHAQVHDNSYIGSQSLVYGDSETFGDAKVYGNSRIYENAKVSGNSYISGKAWIYGNANISGKVRVSGDSKIFGDSKISNDIDFPDHAFISSNRDYFRIEGFGFRNIITTFYIIESGDIWITDNRFSGTISQFRDSVKEIYKNHEAEKAALTVLDLVERQLTYRFRNPDDSNGRS